MGVVQTFQLRMQWSAVSRKRKNAQGISLNAISEEKSERSKSKLVGKGQAHLRVLQHVVETDVLDLVVGCMDMLVTVLEGRLDHECGGVAESTGRGVVGAGVAALGLDIGDVTVLRSSVGGFQSRTAELTVVITSLMKLVRPWST